MGLNTNGESKAISKINIDGGGEAKILSFDPIKKENILEFSLPGKLQDFEVRFGVIYAATTK